MITRLRSDKGSFVRSPLGAFDSEADFECFPARLAIFEQTQEEPRGFDPTPFGPLDAVLVLNIPNQPTGNVFFTFTRDVFPTGNFPPFEVFKDWYFVGRTSGAIWRPSDWGNFVFTYNVVNANTGVPQQNLYTAAPPQAVEGDVEIWNEWYETNASPGPQFFLQTNTGYGIARDLRNPADTSNGIGFVSETVDICDEPPPGVHEFQLQYEVGTTQAFDCSSGFVPSNPPPWLKLFGPNSGGEIWKPQMDPPIPSDANGYYRVTRVLQIRTPTGLVLNTSGVSVYGEIPPCLNEGPSGYWFQFWDYIGPEIPSGQPQYWNFLAYTWEDNLDWPIPGSYIFTLEYEPRPPG